MNNQSSVDKINAKRRRAQKLQHQGEYADAVQQQVELINEQGGFSAERTEDMHLLGLYLFQLGDIPAACTVLKQVYGYIPEHVDVAKNLAICELKLGHYDAALEILERAARAHPENFELRDVLAHTAGQRGDLRLSAQHGQKSIELKHSAVTKNFTQTLALTESPPRLNLANPGENIIAFSLWGQQAKYLDGAIINAKLAPDIYPGWRCRFYLDQSVPRVVVDKLYALGAEIVEMPSASQAFDGLFWRFLVADDERVSRFIVRDCDAVVNIKERAAVDVWCQSSCHFHVMRDFYTHSELILAGMWGGVSGVLPNLARTINDYKASLQLRTRIIDQVFLRERIWPLIHQHTLVHDSQFELPDAQQFPQFARLAEGRHVGQDVTLFS